MNWATLRDAYGAATKVPAILEQLTAKSPAERVKARYRFRSHLVHQGSVYSATAAAIPVLLRLLRSGPDRAEVLCLLQEVAVGDHTNWLANRFEAREGSKTVIDRCYTGVANATPKLVALLSDRDADVRAAAAFVLGWLPTRARASIPKLRARLAVERDEEVRAGLLLALGRLGADSDVVMPYLDSEARVAAAVARAWIDPTTTPARARDVLEHAAKNTALAKTSSPWNWGDLRGLARIVLRTLPREGPFDIRAALERLARAKSGKALLEEVEDTLTTSFPSRPAELSEEHRQWLAALAQREWQFYRVSELLEWRGLPTENDALRSLVGVRPKDLTYLRVNGKKVHDLWQPIVRGRGSATPILRALGPRDGVVAIVGSTRYAEPYARSIDLAVRALAPLAKKHARAAAIELASQRDYVLAKTLVLLLDRANQLTPQFDARFSEALFSTEATDALRSILTRLPLVRREKIIVASRPWTSPRGKPEGTWLYLDLVRTKTMAAHAVLLAIEKGDHVDQRWLQRMLEGFGELAHPAIARALKRRSFPRRALLLRVMANKK